MIMSFLYWCAGFCKQSPVLEEHAEGKVNVMDDGF